MMAKLNPAIFCCMVALAILTGCAAKEHAHVTGVVKINGEPVEGAVVTFAPKEGGRSAFAKTGPDGAYELDYTAGVKGAKIGVNNVYITTYAAPTLDDSNKVVDPGKPERFPPEYNQNPNVTAEVAPGENVIDFQVESSQETYERSQDS